MDKISARYEIMYFFPIINLIFHLNTNSNMMGRV